MKYCKKCGTQMPDEAAFCPECGTPASAPKKAADNLKKAAENPADNAEKTVEDGAAKLNLTKHAAPEPKKEAPEQTPKSEQTEPERSEPRENQNRSGNAQPDFNSGAAWNNQNAESSSQSDVKKKKLPLPALIAIIGGAAAAVIIAVAVNLPKSTPAVPQPAAEISVPVQSASPTMPPEPSVVAAEEETGDFTLTQQQATELLTDVAAPLLLTEWNAVMTYPDVYDPRDWQNLPHVEISGLSDRETVGEVYGVRPYWIEFYTSLFEVDDRGIDNGYDESLIFENDSYHEGESGRISADKYAVRQYFYDAFGTDIPEQLMPEYNGGSFEELDDYTIDLGEPYVDIVVTDLPTGSVEVKDGKVTFTGNFTGMITWDQPWQIPSDYLPWTITLDVVENKDSRFGCNVTGYQASAVMDNTAVGAQTETDLDGQWYNEHGLAFQIEGRFVTVYSGYFEDAWDTQPAIINSDGSMLVTLAAKGDQEYLIEPQTDGTIYITHLSTDGNYYDNPERLLYDRVADTISSNLDGEWMATPALPEDSDSFLIEGNRVTMTSYYGKPLVGITNTGEWDADGSLNVAIEYKGDIYHLTFTPVDQDSIFVTNTIEGYGSDSNYYYRIGSSQTSLSSPAGFDSNGFLFPDSSTRYLTAEELAPLDKEMLGYARNEIFARHGNVFETPKYINHYSQYAWYNNIPKVADVGYPDLNDIEIANVELIKQFENQ